MISGLPELTASEEKLLRRIGQLGTALSAARREAGGRLEIHLRNSHATFGWAAPELRRAYYDAIPRRMRADGERGTEGR